MATKKADKNVAKKRLIKQKVSENIKHCLIINTKWLNEMIKSRNKTIKQAQLNNKKGHKMCHYDITIISKL